MKEAVYILCAVASFFCAFLLFRGYRARPSKLLLWSTVCFAGLAMNNTLLFIDLSLLPETVDLSIYRNLLTLGSLSLLLYGLIWDVV